MTKAQALAAAVALPVEALQLEKALLDADITGSETYAKTSQTLIDRAAIELLQGLKSTKNVQEGGYSLTLDLNAINERIEYLAGRAGLTHLLIVEKRPTVQDASHLW